VCSKLDTVFAIGRTPILAPGSLSARQPPTLDQLLDSLSRQSRVYRPAVLQTVWDRVSIGDLALRHHLS
jgi:hypothetical protein